jgi:hypothetical protein
MAVPTVIADLSPTAASNSPAGSDNGSTTDDFIRALSGFIAELRDGKAAITSPAIVGTATYGGEEIGWRDVNTSSTSVTAAVSDRGKCVVLAAGITIPNSTFAAGDAFSLYNDTAGALTITQGSGLTLRLGGSTTTGNRTLAARGLATVWFKGASEAIMTGAGVS